MNLQTKKIDPVKFRDTMMDKIQDILLSFKDDEITLFEAKKKIETIVEVVENEFVGDCLQIIKDESPDICVRVQQLDDMNIHQPTIEPVVVMVASHLKRRFQDILK